jgi:[CysO sulfur-carrier protein]-S-L-cysteine hydrolase
MGPDWHGSVLLPAALADAIVLQARRESPLETCGLLVGRAGVVVRLVPTTNAEASPTRYTIPAVEHLAAVRAARHDGLEVVGAYHSHPRSDAVPSVTDVGHAFPNFVFVIAGLEPEAALRAWQLVDGNFVELRLVGT